MKLFGTMSKALSTIAVIAILAGCSSSSTDDGAGAAGDPDVTYSGVFIDATVTGLSYSCEGSGLTGKTDAEGKFSYKGADRCTFSVGDIVLGDTAPKPVVTPMDLLSKYTYDELVNMLRFLQTLDMNPDLEGIQLPENLINNVEEFEFDVQDGMFWEMFDLLLQNNSGLEELIIVEEEEALEHFYGATTPYFQMALTVDMFNDKMISWEGGEQIILTSDTNFELMMFDNTVAELCTGTWAVSETKLNLTVEKCNGRNVEVDTVVEIDFVTSPAADTYFRVKMIETNEGGSIYGYSFAYIEVLGDAVAPAAPSNLSVDVSGNGDETTLNWVDNANNETKFVVEISAYEDFRESDLTVATSFGANTTTTGAQDTSGAIAGITVYSRVKATNLAGDSVYSNTVSHTY